MDEEKGPKDNGKGGLMIGGLPPKRWNGPPYTTRKRPICDHHIYNYLQLFGFCN
jgi:hypothetical protein